MNCLAVFFTLSVLVSLSSARTFETMLERQLQTKRIYEQSIAQAVIKNAPRGARLISTKTFRSGNGLSSQELESRLIDNATLIRDDIRGGFSCTGKIYGYYADTNNDCQIFHICVPLKQLFPKLFSTSDIMDFSFICPKHTIFTQDALVCAWERSAVSCDMAERLYTVVNERFFVVEKENSTDSSDAFGAKFS